MHVLLSKPYSDPSHTNMSGLPPKTRVLLTAPSNHAADLLCQKLAETWDRFGEIEDLGPAREGIFRLNAFRRHQRSVSLYIYINIYIGIPIIVFTFTGIFLYIYIYVNDLSCRVMCVGTRRCEGI